MHAPDVLYDKILTLLYFLQRFSIPILELKKQFLLIFPPMTQMAAQMFQMSESRPALASCV